MGGGIGVESKPGKGSTFWFEVQFGPVSVKLEESEAEGSIEGLRILVVDDNATNRSIFSKMLVSLGCKTTTVASGVEVLPELFRGLLTNDPYQLVVLDMQMPGMDGEETLRIIRRENLTRDIKVVVLTSMGRRNELKKLSDLGCSGYLLKPVRQSNLRNILEYALGFRKKIDRHVRFKVEDAGNTDQLIPPMKILVVEDNLAEPENDQHLSHPPWAFCRAARKWG